MPTPPMAWLRVVTRSSHEFWFQGRGPHRFALAKMVLHVSGSEQSQSYCRKDAIHAQPMIVYSIEAR